MKDKDEKEVEYRFVLAELEEAWKELQKFENKSLKSRNYYEPKCSFCGARKSEVEVLIASANTYICDGCVVKCVELIKTEKSD